MPIRPDLFTHTVNQLLYGATASQVSDELAECVGRAQETGKQAKLTLTLTVKPLGRDTGQYEIRDSVKATLPELDRGVTLMFGTPEGDLSRTDPRQADLNLKVLPNDKPTELKTAENN